jgi:hypothetical protein
MPEEILDWIQMWTREFDFNEETAFENAGND